MFINKMPATGTNIGSAMPMGSSTGRLSSSLDRMFDQLAAGEVLELVRKDILLKLEEDMEDARLRYEEENDDVSLGEYIGLQAAVKRAKTFVEHARGRVYNEPYVNRDSRDAIYQYYGVDPSQARITRITGTS